MVNRTVSVSKPLLIVAETEQTVSRHCPHVHTHHSNTLGKLDYLAIWHMTNAPYWTCPLDVCTLVPVHSVNHPLSKCDPHLTGLRLRTRATHCTVALPSLPQTMSNTDVWWTQMWLEFRLEDLDFNIFVCRDWLSFRKKWIFGLFSCLNSRQTVLSAGLLCLAQLQRGHWKINASTKIAIWGGSYTKPDYGRFSRTLNRVSVVYAFSRQMLIKLPKVACWRQCFSFFFLENQIRRLRLIYFCVRDPTK